ncbi:hypothetical protein [Actinoplanes subtropicus]|uniref:hypothetical protein n=1 Tax=Actinoplanes subtropicus TaxID=543632 RepID=UPI0004C3EA5A|nr:hypothetical protein [Actinoplanes subtropicus]
MQRTKLALITAVLAIAGCDPQPGPAASATSAAAAPTSAAAATADAATAKACTALQKDIKDNAALVAKDQKIGPPAGHIAVSAQWSAGAAAISEHSIGVNEAVAAAATKVQQTMADLSDEYNKPGNGKHSTAKLDAAVKELTAACSR